MLADFNEDNNQTSDNRERITELRDNIAKDWPDALPDPRTARPIYHEGHILTLEPIAVSVTTTQAMVESTHVIADKLAHALYYRDTGRSMTPGHRFFASVHQIQSPGVDVLIAFLRQRMPDLILGTRSNIPKYGNRFGYRSFAHPQEDLFVYAGQLGYGLMCWGMVLGPGVVSDDSNIALNGMKWKSGANGLGSQR